MRSGISMTNLNESEVCEGGVDAPGGITRAAIDRGRDEPANLTDPLDVIESGTRYDTRLCSRKQRGGDTTFSHAIDDASDSTDDDNEAVTLDDVVHCVVIPNYQEPVGTLARTLDTLAAQRRAPDCMVIVLAMEARESWLESGGASYLLICESNLRYE